MKPKNFTVQYPHSQISMKATIPDTHGSYNVQFESWQHALTFEKRPPVNKNNKFASVVFVHSFDCNSNNGNEKYFVQPDANSKLLNYEFCCKQNVLFLGWYNLQLYKKSWRVFLIIQFKNEIKGNVQKFDTIRVWRVITNKQVTLNYCYYFLQPEKSRISFLRRKNYFTK